MSSMSYLTMIEEPELALAIVAKLLKTMQKDPERAKEFSISLIQGRLELNVDLSRSQKLDFWLGMDESTTERKPVSESHEETSSSESQEETSLNESQEDGNLVVEQSELENVPKQTASEESVTEETVTEEPVAEKPKAKNRRTKIDKKRRDALLKSIRDAKDPATAIECIRDTFLISGDDELATLKIVFYVALGAVSEQKRPEYHELDERKKSALEQYFSALFSAKGKRKIFNEAMILMATAYLYGHPESSKESDDQTESAEDAPGRQIIVGLNDPTAANQATSTAKPKAPELQVVVGLNDPDGAIKEGTAEETATSTAEEEMGFAGETAGNPQ